MIEKFAQEVHFSVDPSKGSKQQVRRRNRQVGTFMLRRLGAYFSAPPQKN